MPTCVVLNGRGFVGRSLVSRLLRLGNWTVRVADSFQTLNLDESDSVLLDALSSGRASYHCVDVRDKPQIVKLSFGSWMLALTEGSYVVFYMGGADDLHSHDYFYCYKCPDHQAVLDNYVGASSSKVAERLKSGSLWTSKSELVDGLCLPPTDPKKVNKMIRTQRHHWIKLVSYTFLVMSYMKSFGREVHIVPAIVDRFDMPAPTMTPELSSDFNLFWQLRDVMDPKKHYKRVPTQSKLAEKYFQASWYSEVMLVVFCKSRVQYYEVTGASASVFPVLDM
ncbi:hypothetical protein Bca52824_022695 [Brassica carinata]|uniref:Uncharacterized protein n=1 Tax=Brassica carinata TaxID=52824 RepID=A0A8X8ATN1_BRACI|nr:hypothetical protein Bca52824_022695 [Brassica carinata]